MPTFPSKRYPLLAALVSGVLYLAFLSSNPVVDAVYYAWCGRYGHELAHPHHLLYNYWLRSIMLITGGAGENTIYLFQAGNALAGGGCIGLLCRILQKSGLPERAAFWLSLAVAGSWGFVRFATDNETYVLPILFSLIGLSLVVTRPALVHKTPGMAYLLGWNWAAGLFSAIAILFHQVQVWWALPMLWLVWRLGGMRPALSFAAWHLLVPIGYWLVWKLDVDQTLADFLLGEFKAGGVHTGWGWMTVAKTAVQAVRSFFQIHDTILTGLPSLFAFLPYAYLFGFLAFAALLWIKWKQEIPPIIPSLTQFSIVLGLSLIAFSFFSQGNAEFLAGLPFAAVLWLGRKDLVQRLAPGLAVSIWFWNILFGLRIQTFYQIEPDRQIARIIHSQKVDAVLLSHKLEVDWWHAYLYGARPADTYHMQWLVPNTKFGSSPILYDGKPIEWQKIVYEDCRLDLEVYRHFHVDGSGWPCLGNLPGYRNGRVLKEMNFEIEGRSIHGTKLVKATRNL